MDKIIIPASITLERGESTQRHKWTSEKNKESVYRRICRRAVIRFTCRNFADKVNKLKRENRQILVTFNKDNFVSIKRIDYSGISMQGYSGKHPYIQIVINRCLPSKFWNNLNKNKSFTFKIKVELSCNEWKDVGLIPSDFLLEVEKDSKILLDIALIRGFQTQNISKGREYDLGLITPSKREIIIALSSHVAKTKSRSKEKTIQKILMDISKMLPYLYENNHIVPVIITRPINFENSWSFTTKKYLDFYEREFGFKFITTEFKNGWEDDIIKELCKI